MKGRNALCFCGSGKKYKKCHIPLKEAVWRDLTTKLRQAETIGKTLPELRR